MKEAVYFNVFIEFTNKKVLNRYIKVMVHKLYEYFHMQQYNLAVMKYTSILIINGLKLIHFLEI